MIRGRCELAVPVEKARCADELTIPFLFYRTNSQKPDDELIRQFQRTFSDIISKQGRDDSADQAPNELVNPSRYILLFSPRITPVCSLSTSDLE